MSLYTLVVKTDDAIKESAGVYRWNVNWNMFLDMHLKPNTTFDIEHSFQSNPEMLTTETVLSNTDSINPVVIACNLQTNGYSPPSADSQTRGGVDNSRIAPYAAGPNDPINVAVNRVVYASATQLFNQFYAEKNIFYSRNVYNMSPLYIYTYKKSGTSYILADCSGVHMFTFKAV